jgi:hypothetical protein
MSQITIDNPGAYNTAIQAKDFFESVSITGMSFLEAYNEFAAEGGDTRLQALEQRIDDMMTVISEGGSGRKQSVLMAMLNSQADNRRVMRGTSTLSRVMSAVTKLSVIMGAASAVMGAVFIFCPSETDEVLDKLDQLSRQVEQMGARLSEEIKQLGDEIKQEIYFQSYNDALARIAHAEKIWNLRRSYSSYFALGNSCLACDNVVEAIYTYDPAAGTYDAVNLGTADPAEAPAVTAALSNWTQAIGLRLVPAAFGTAPNRVATQGTTSRLTLAVPVRDGQNTLVFKVRNLGGPAGFIATFPALDDTGAFTQINTSVTGWQVADVAAGARVPPPPGSSAWQTPTSQGAYAAVDPASAAASAVASVVSGALGRLGTILPGAGGTPGTAAAPPNPVYANPWGARVAGFPVRDTLAPEWIWKGSLAGNDLATEIWVKCSFAYDAGKLVTGPLEDMSALSRDLLMGFDTDDLADDLFRIMVNTLGTGDSLSPGLLDFIDTTYNHSPTLVWKYAQLVLNMVTRGTRMLGYIRCYQATEKYLMSQGVVDPIYLTADQNAAYARIAGYATQSVSDLFENSGDHRYNLGLQIARKANALTNRMLGSKAALVSGLEAHVGTIDIKACTGNQDYVDKVYRAIDTWYGRGVGTFPRLAWIVVMADGDIGAMAKGGDYVYFTANPDPDNADRILYVFGKTASFDSAGNPTGVAASAKAAIAGRLGSFVSREDRAAGRAGVVSMNVFDAQRFCGDVVSTLSSVLVFAACDRQLDTLIGFRGFAYRCAPDLFYQFNGTAQRVSVNYAILG